MKPNEVTCPVCAAPPDAPCVYKKADHGPYGPTRPHEARFTLAYGYPGLAVECETCKQPPGALCRDMRTRALRFNTSFHVGRDTAAFAARAGKTVVGLSYPNGTKVREPWINADKTRKKDGLRSVRFRKVGNYAFCYWGCTYNGKLWIAHLKRNVALHEARRRKFESPVDSLGDLTRRATTIWVD